MPCSILKWLLPPALVLLLVCPANNAQPPTETPKPTGAQKEPQAAASAGRTRPAVYTKLRKEPGITDDEKASIKDNCLFGMPKLNPTAPLGTTHRIVRKGYVLEHSDRDKIALWVCEHSTLAEVAGDLATKSNPFKPDPKLGGLRRGELADYKGSGFDRGHLAPAGNQTEDKQLRDETFFLSNIVPQDPNLNRGVWRVVEQKVRGWTKARGETWIMTGPMFYDPLEEDPKTADGLVHYNVIGEGEVARSHSRLQDRRGQEFDGPMAIHRLRARQQAPRPASRLHALPHHDRLDRRADGHRLPAADRHRIGGRRA